MYSRNKTFLFLTFILFTSAIGITVVLGESEQVYSALEKAFYLSPEDGVWIRPGLKLRILDVAIPGDRKPVVTFEITDDMGQTLDREGKITPGVVSTSFILAHIPKEADQYVSYTTRAQTSPITGVREVQASTDSGGKYTSLGAGTYTYTFGTALPANYDASTTHTLGIYAARDLREFGLSRYIANELKNWVPDGSQVTKIRDVAGTLACNQCHNPLGLHGGARQKMELCVLCHTPQTKDPDTGNTVDMKVMIHKIHMGEHLPSVQGGKPYQIIGHQQTVADYSEVAFPQELRNCTTCHKNASQTNNIMLNPTRDTCGSCHDDIEWTTGTNHIAGAQHNDSECASCHTPEGEYEYDASIGGAHIASYKSAQLRKPKLEITSVTNTAPGQKPVVQFKITDKEGVAIAPSDMGGTKGRLALTLAGPTGDYRWYVQEAANNASYADGVATYTFTAPIPSDAKGSYALEAEGYVNTTLNPGTKKSLVFRDAIENVVQHFAVTGKMEHRRSIVDMAKCNRCHDKLQLHGNNRNNIDACILCHNPAMTDKARRPSSDLPAETIDIKILIHRIHTGEELDYDFTVYGFGNTPHNYNKIRYPGDRRDCLQCHKTATYTLPIAKTATASVTPRGFFDPTQPTSAACLGCHDSKEAAAHAYLNTATFGESCAVCHKETAEFAVSKVHAR